MLSLAKSLFTGVPYVAITTALSLDDFIVSDLPSEDFHPHSRSIKSKGVALTLKDSAVEAILTAFSTDKVTYAKVDRLDSTMIDFPSIKCTLHSYTTLKVTKDVSFRGLRSKSAKLARFDEVQQRANEEFESNKATLIDEAIAKLNKSLSDIVGLNNKNIVYIIKSIVINLNVDNSVIDSLTTDNEKAVIKKNDSQVAEIDKQIDALNKRKKTLTDETYHIKRASLASKIKSECDQPIKDLVDSIAHIKRSTTSLFSDY